MSESWTKDCDAQKNLTALLQEKIILPQMRSKALKSISDPRIREILKFNTNTINRKIISTWNEIKNDVPSSVVVGLVGSRRNLEPEEEKKIEDCFECRMNDFADLRLPISWSLFNDSNAHQPPNKIVAFFLLPPMEGNARVVLEDEGQSISVFGTPPQILDEHFLGGSTTPPTEHAERVLFNARLAAFQETKMKILNWNFKQTLILPFKVESRFLQRVVDLNGFDFMEVILTKFIEQDLSVEVIIEKRVRASVSSTSAPPPPPPLQGTTDPIHQVPSSSFSVPFTTTNTSNTAIFHFNITSNPKPNNDVEDTTAK